MISRNVLIHIPDADGKDACDYAKENGLALEMREFLNCSKKKKDNDMKQLSKRQTVRDSELNDEIRRSRAASIVSRGRRGSRRGS